jgi:hypothetical protein
MVYCCSYSRRWYEVARICAARINSRACLQSMLSLTTDDDDSPTEIQVSNPTPRKPQAFTMSKLLAGDVVLDGEWKI